MEWRAPAIVWSLVAGIALGMNIVQWWRRRRDKRWAQEDLAELRLAWSRDLWTTIDGWGTLLGDLRAGQHAELVRSGELTGVEPAISSAMEQGAGEYDRALRSALRGFPELAMDPVMVVGLNWASMELTWRTCVISRERHPDALRESTAALRAALEKHQDELRALRSLMATEYPEITRPAPADTPVKTE